MKDSRLIELLTKSKSGEFSLLERKELQDLIRSRQDYAMFSDLLDEVYKGSVSFNYKEDFHRYIAEAWEMVKAGTDDYDDTKSFRRPRFQWGTVGWLAIAASFLVAVIFLALTLNKKENNSGKTNIVSTKAASKSNLVLPDGTKIWLNDDTKIFYNENFSKQNREITLIGEAYFDVVRDVNHPFIIHTSTMDIKVLGTKFNVRAYENEKENETLLIKGSVEVTLRNYNNKKVMLEPLEKLSVQNIPSTEKSVQNNSQQLRDAFYKLSKVNATTDDSLILETEWINHKLVFDHARLEDMIPQLERWYGVKIIINNQELKQKEFSGIYKDRPIEEVLESLRLAGNFMYKVENDSVTIYKGQAYSN